MKRTVRKAVRKAEGYSDKQCWWYWMFFSAAALTGTAGSQGEPAWGKLEA